MLTATVLRLAKCCRMSPTYSQWYVRYPAPLDPLTDRCSRNVPLQSVVIYTDSSTT